MANIIVLICIWTESKAYLKRWKNQYAAADPRTPPALA